MNDPKHSRHPHGDPNGGHLARPYWTRAHRDWRVWLGVILMLIAMFIFMAAQTVEVAPTPLPPPNTPAK